MHCPRPSDPRRDDDRSLCLTSGPAGRRSGPGSTRLHREGPRFVTPIESVIVTTEELHAGGDVIALERLERAPLVRQADLPRKAFRRARHDTAATEPILGGVFLSVWFVWLLDLTIEDVPAVIASRHPGRLARVLLDARDAR